MPIRFEKYHGAGNDFVLVDDREAVFPLTHQKLIQTLCDRHFGIGADGLILLRRAQGEGANPAPEARAAFAMVYFNADGLPGSLCGNGGRCAVQFAQSLGLVEGEVWFEASDGMHRAEMLDDGRIALDMAPVGAWQRDGEAWVLDTGSPHYVLFGSDWPSLDPDREGKAIRWRADYARAGGINVNFAGPGSGSAAEPLLMRTFERGVEAETLACGTGAVATALGMVLSGRLPRMGSCWLRSPGGLLEVSYRFDGVRFSGIQLRGPAVRVFSGIWFGDPA
jgi:diaminopimelate epimerase